jgi:hypothetical protein
MDYVVERFHGRSLALAHSQEEIEELDLRNSHERLTDDRYCLPSDYFCGRREDINAVRISFVPRKFVRRGTYRLRKNRMTPSVVQEDETLERLTQSMTTKQKLKAKLKI